MTRHHILFDYTCITFMTIHFFEHTPSFTIHPVRLYTCLTIRYNNKVHSQTRLWYSLYPCLTIHPVQEQFLILFNRMQYFLTSLSKILLSSLKVFKCFGTSLFARAENVPLLFVSPRFSTCERIRNLVINATPFSTHQ